MNTRIHQTLSKLRSQNRKALSIFITAGYPSVTATPEIIGAVEEAGADIIELGIPFSDPLADGPTIQLASDRAIKNGVNVTTVFDIVMEIRKISQIPIILMGYVNPLIAFGLERFMQTASACGVDGLIIPDIPVEESTAYRARAHDHNLAPIFLSAPTTSDDRLRQIDMASEGFVYCVSITGVTGQSNGIPDTVKEYLQRCRNNITKNPVLVGFGISSGKNAHMLAPYADGIIVGSALIKIINNNRNKNYIAPVKEFVKELKKGLKLRESE